VNFASIESIASAILARIVKTWPYLRATLNSSIAISDAAVAYSPSWVSLHQRRSVEIFQPFVLHHGGRWRLIYGRAKT
jgi:hypothetical protein